MKTNLWILTEERPKRNVLATILQKFLDDYCYAGTIENLRIIPILETGKFTFTYEVTGFECEQVEKVLIKTISGSSSFTDFLIFYQQAEPTQQDKPIYAIEETKTDEKESRNTAVAQRCSKFVFIENYYPGIKKVMLYNIQIERSKKPPTSVVFATKLLLTLGVEIIGKDLDKTVFQPFKNVDEIIEFKSKMPPPPKGNVPVLLNRSENKIQISGRLFKSGSLSHDPNIGQLSLISAVLRKLGWKNEIEITRHGLEQIHVGKTNKFIQIANTVKILLENLTVPAATLKPNYWKDEKEGEKLGTIFIHIAVENFTSAGSIFENHAGSEKGYFIKNKGETVPLAKYKDKEKYKAGDKEEIIHIPDLILIDRARREIINIEGKKYKFRQNGINELNNYDHIEENYISTSYPEYKIIRTVVLFGSQEQTLAENEIGFLLNENGELVLGKNAPAIFKEALKNLSDYWSK